MDFLQTLARRNQTFAENDFCADLKMMPSQRTTIIGCVDPRVDPMNVLKLEPGEAAVIRNVGGRVNPALLETMALLRSLSKARGSEIGEGWNLILLHHTDCGIVGCSHNAPQLLAKHLGVAPQDLSAKAIDDPYQSVALDIAALKANPNLPADLVVTGLVYDVATGRIDTVVPASALRSE